MSRRRAFTLLETLLALALLAGLLTAATTLVVQFSSTWAAQADEPVLDRHTESLDRLLRHLFAHAGYTGVSTPAADLASAEGALLTFREVPPDLPWFEHAALAGGTIEGRLAFSRATGLTLRWNTRREISLALGEPHATAISPWVVDAALLVRPADAAEWTDATPARDPASGSAAADPAAFRVLRLDLEHLGRRRTLHIPLPRLERTTPP